MVAKSDETWTEERYKEFAADGTRESALTEVVVPAFSALLAASPGNGKLLHNVLCNHAPALDAKLGH